MQQCGTSASRPCAMTGKMCDYIVTLTYRGRWSHPIEIYCLTIDIPVEFWCLSMMVMRLKFKVKKKHNLQSSLFPYFQEKQDVKQEKIGWTSFNN